MSNKAIFSELSKAEESITRAKQLLVSGVTVPKEEPQKEEPSKKEQPYIILPREGTDSLNKFYGRATRQGNNLVWFNFPLKNMRLYSRNGANLSDRDGDGFDDHRCHRLIAKRLESALLEIFQTLGVEEFMRQGWHVYSGCFNYRTKRGGSSFSTHSWGISVDMNSAENAFNSTETTFSDEAIDIMEKHGFLSGGRAWGKDWMHFQAAIPRISSGSFYHKHGLPSFIKAA